MRSGETSRERNTRVFGCEDPVAFVTGSAAPRVGRVVAEHLLAQGFRVVVHGNRSRPDPAEAARWSAVMQGSVEDELLISEWADKILTQLGRVDLLVNSAATWEKRKLEETTAADFEASFRVNALGTALTCKHFGQLMCQQSSGGAIVNISDWAVCRPYADFAAYFPSKTAVLSITQSMAVELASRNASVRVNAVLPGPVLLDDSISEENRQAVADACLLKREGTADDVAEAVLFLATSPFVTGVCLPVDGGRTIHAGPASDVIAHPEAD